MNRFADLVVEPTLWFLADWSIRWAVLIAVLAAWLLLVRPRRTATRYLVRWIVLLVGLAIPVVPRWGPGFAQGHSQPPETASKETDIKPGAVDALNSIPAPNTPPPVSEVKIDAVDSKRAESPPAVTPTPAPTIEFPSGADSLGVRRWALLAIAALWVAGILLFVVRWVVGWYVLRRLRHQALPLSGSSGALLAECAADLRLRRRAFLASHPRVRSPLTLGLWRPMILVPLDWPQLTSTAQRSSLLHELAHLARYDDWLALPLEMVRAVFWLHPLVRWLLARIERERIGPDAKDAIPELQRLFKSKDENISISAGKALKAIAR